ncbi:MAG: hypothetical protein JXJ04_20700 [Spirochaetales bacterium]|nr:hypothetical protein [Spirochaetales bacterium]
MRNKTYFLRTHIFLLLFLPIALFANGAGEVTGENQLVCIINYPYQIWSQSPTKIHVTLFTPDFTPAKGAVVKVNDKDVGKADKNGTCIFDFVPGNESGHTLYAELIKNNTRYQVTKPFSCNSRTISFKAERLYVYTDRGVYNPGQDIFIRLVAWELKQEYSPIADAKIQLLFQDLNGKIYSGDFMKTDEFGVGAMTLPLPAHMPEGDYELVVLYEQARETARLRVKRFVPPVINISHTLKRYLTTTQTSLDAEVNLSYFSGGEVKKSTLVMTVKDPEKKEIFQKEYSSETHVYNITLDKTELDVIRKALIPENEIKMNLTVTDSYGQKDEIEWDMLYTSRPFTAVMEIDKDSYPEGETVQALIKVVDIDKQPAADIPLILEGDGGQIKKTVTTDSKGVAVFEFIMPPYAVNAVVKSPVMEPILCERYIPLEIRKPMSSKVSDLPQDAGTKTKITLRFDPEYIPLEKVIHVDLTDISGALVESTTIPVNQDNTGARAEGTITAPTWGSMLVNLYCCAVKKGTASPYTVDTAGFITEGQHVTFYPDKELEIIVENFKPEGAPGEKVSFTINVKGGEGEKSLGVSVVDDAVISLLDPFVKAPLTHFYNPQAKVIASGGAGVLTWPVVDRNWGSPWRDIAYSNWGWKGPGPFVFSNRSKDDADGNYAADEEMATAGGDKKFEKSMDSSEMGDDFSSATKNPDYDMAMETEPMEDKSLDEVQDGQNRKNGEDAQQTTTIVIRTEFPATAFWDPAMVTKNGKAKVDITLPEEITTQKLSILASDKHGFIGLVKKEIRVTQPLFIRADFPAAMTKGDTITAKALLRNLSDAPLSCTATLESKDLNIRGKETIDISLKAGEITHVAWEIQGTTCGSNSYTVSIRTKGGKFSDAEQKSLYILPQGDPEIHLVRETIDSRNKFTGSVYRDPSSDYFTGFLNVSLPSVFPAFQAWYAVDIKPWYTPWAVAASAIMNSALLDYVQTSQHGTDEETQLKERLQYAGLLLSSSQLSDGAWDWYSLSRQDVQEQDSSGNGNNLYYTLYCLRGLLEIKQAGIIVNDETMNKAIRSILSKKNQSGLWSSKGAYFWDVYNEQTDYALSAEIFEVLSRALLLINDPSAFESTIRLLKERLVKKLTGSAEEPMFVAATLQGLMYWQKYAQDASIEEVLKQSIAHLITLKRRGYWEPQWYHAYGGMVELNARILTLLAEYGPDNNIAILREGITWLLSTREAWGAWHNEIGTANAIRALLKAGVFAEETKSEITIKINGKTTTTVKIDPSDPFLSAAKLNYYEITGFLAPGENKVEVTYSGNLTGSVILETNEWGKDAGDTKGLIGVTKSLPKEGTIGQPLTVKLSLSSDKQYNLLIIREPLPSQCEVDVKSLDNLIKTKGILDYSLEEGTLILTCMGSSVTNNNIISYILQPKRKGTGMLRKTRVLDGATGALIGESVSSSFAVQ